MQMEEEKTKVIDIKKAIKTHKDLKAYQDSYALSLDVHKTTLTFPEVEQRGLADQMRNICKSICVNIAEGYLKQQAFDVEYRQFIDIAINLVSEMQVLTEFSADLGYIDSEKGKAWTVSFESISRMLHNLKLRN